MRGIRYDWHQEIGLWLPKKMSEDYTTRVEMNEAYRAAGSAFVQAGSQHITCKAEYKNYRRFEVQTEERYSLPR